MRRGPEGSPRSLRPSPREAEEGTGPVTGRRRPGGSRLGKAAPQVTVGVRACMTTGGFAVGRALLCEDFANRARNAACSTREMNSTVITTPLSFTSTECLLCLNRVMSQVDPSVTEWWGEMSEQSDMGREGSGSVLTVVERKRDRPDREWSFGDKVTPRGWCAERDHRRRRSRGRPAGGLPADAEGES